MLGRRLRGDALTFCYGYITGAGDLHRALVKPLACGSGDVTLDQSREAFGAWARANPAELDGPAIDGPAEAAAARWPLPRPLKVGGLRACCGAGAD